MDIASPWDQRVYEKEGEKIEKYLEVVPVVVGALGVVSNRLDAWLEKLKRFIYIIVIIKIFIEIYSPADVRSVQFNSNKNKIKLIGL